MLGETMSINKLFAVLDCQPTTPNRLRGEARSGRRAIYVDRSRRPDGDLRDKPGCVPASGCTKGAPWRATRCIGADGSPVGGAQQRRPSPYLVSQEEKPSKSARGAGPPGKAKARGVIRRLGYINAILLGGVAFGVVHLWLSWACCHPCKSQSPGAQCCCPVIRLRFVCALVRLTGSIAPDHYTWV